MRNNVLKFLVVAFLSMGYIAQAQSDDLSKIEAKVITGVYEELTDDGYNFWAAKSKEDNIIFGRALKEVLKKYDLDSKELIGQKFEITYKTITESVEYGDEDDDGEEQESVTIHVIIHLKKLD